MKKIKEHLKFFTKSLLAGGFILMFTFFVSGGDALAISAVVTEPTDVQKQIAFNKPGVVFISTYVSGEMVVQASADYPALSGKGYPFEVGAFGSGMVITPDGYILTNGHVVKFTEDQLFYYAAQMAMVPLIKDIMYTELVNAYGYVPSDQEIESYLPTIFAELGGEQNFLNEMMTGFRSGEIKLSNVKTDVYVQTGAFVSGKKIPMEQGLKAEVKKVDFEGITDEGEVRGKDIALIKVPGTNMPTVTLGDSSSLQVGQEINVIGYPGVATFAEFLSEESSMEPTVTTGVISASKKMKDGTEVLQTDAAVTHGNSGGPAFTEADGSVIGIASMVALDETGQQKEGFSYLRPINVAKEFVKEAGVTNLSGETDKHYREGLELFWGKHYTPAITEFTTAKNLYPNLIDVSDYIQAAETGKSQGQEVALDKKKSKDKNGDEKGGLSFTTILGVLILIGIVVIIVQQTKKSKAAKPKVATEVKKEEEKKDEEKKE